MDVEQMVYVFGELGLRISSQRRIEQGLARDRRPLGVADGNTSAHVAYLDRGLLLIFAAEEPADAVHGDVENRSGAIMELP
jgi:hypothetical protein